MKQKDEWLFQGSNDDSAAVSYAHRLVRFALRNNILTGPDHCENCGKKQGPPIRTRKNGRQTYTDPILAHHEDYARPLHVVWLCQRCHYLRHSSDPATWRWGAEAFARLAEKPESDPVIPAWMFYDGKSQLP